MKNTACPGPEEIDEQKFIMERYRNYRRLMFSVAQKYVSHGQDREDIIQDCLLKLVQKASDLQKLEPFAQVTYIVTTVRNASINFLRHRDVVNSHIVPMDYCSSGELSCRDELAQQLHRKDQLRSLLDSLSEKDRELVIGRFVLGLSDEELAQRLGFKQSSIHTKLTRIKKRLLADFQKSEEGS